MARLLNQILHRVFLTSTRFFTCTSHQFKAMTLYGVQLYLLKEHMKHEGQSNTTRNDLPVSRNRIDLTGSLFPRH